MSHYMAELVLAGRPVLMIGGGRVAVRKLQGLAGCAAQVTVVAPELDEELANLVALGRARHLRGSFHPGLLDRAPRPFLVFAVTSRAGLNQEIARLCAERGLLCNSADNPRASGFLVPAVVRQGPVSWAVSTAGRSPALSRLLKERLLEWLEPGWGALAEAFGAIRPRVQASIVDVEKRRLFWREASLAVARERRFEQEEGNEAWLAERLRRADGTAPE